MRTANQRVERTGGSRLAQLQFERHRRLPPVAHAFRPKLGGSALALDSATEPWYRRPYERTVCIR
jgi:hypothetical protein